IKDYFANMRSHGYSRVNMCGSDSSVTTEKERNTEHVYLVKSEGNTKCTAHYYDGTKWCQSKESDLSMTDTSMLYTEEAEKIKKIISLCDFPQTYNDKAQNIKLLQAEGHVVGFAGDGMNDLPAMEAADVGMAIGFWTHA